MNKDAMYPAKILFRPNNVEWKQENRIWQGIPGIERTSNGRLYATWYTGGVTEEPGNIVLLEKSDDDGRTWTDCFIVVWHENPEIRCFDECIWIDPLGRLWLFWMQAPQILDAKAGVWCAVCDNPDADQPVFGEIRRIADGVMLNKPIVTKDGRWLFPCAVWRDGLARSTPAYPELEGKRLASVVESGDEGRTFTWLGGANVPNRWFHEHNIVELNDGRLWMLVRTSYGLGQAFSSDGGITWTEQGDSGHTGPNSRCFLRRLASGRLLLINHVNPTYRTNPKDWNVRNNLMALLSEDDGKTWIGGLMLDTRNEVSYPDGVQAENGDIYIIYDFQRYKSREILLAVFREEDVLEGRLVSPNARLKQRINQATGGTQGALPLDPA